MSTLEKQVVLAVLRDHAVGLACAEPARMIGEPCSCAAGFAQAIAIVEGMR